MGRRPPQNATRCGPTPAELLGEVEVVGVFPGMSLFSARCTLTNLGLQTGGPDPSPRILRVVSFVFEGDLLFGRLETDLGHGLTDLRQRDPLETVRGLQSETRQELLVIIF